MITEHLVDGLFDDAAIFPPGNMAMRPAVEAHLHRQATSTARYVGPFVCTAPRWPELVEALPTGAHLDVSLTFPGGSAGLPTALADAATEERVRLVSVEVPLAGQPLTSFLADLRVRAEGVTVYVEIPASELTAVTARRLAEAGHRLKVRTGGESADRFPTEHDLANAIEVAVRAELPFKLTAGLHHAVRHRDPVTGFEHHGFLNVIVATHAAMTGNAVEEVLAARDGEALAAAAREILATARVRDQFLSFGTCSIDEPIAELVDQRLIEKGD